MSDNEQRPGENPMVDKVSGYRKLTDSELALVNEMKAKGPELEDLFNRVGEVIRERNNELGTPDAESYRALALGKTNIQQGFMWLIRAVAAPQGMI